MAPKATETDEASETGKAPPTERADDVEQPADGSDGRVSVELAGLPIGNNETLDVDGTWCQVLFWDGTLPGDVRLDIESVVVGEPGGRLRGFGCDGAPPCAGLTIDAESSRCAVAVTPDDPSTELVRVRFDGVLSCPDRETCDALVPAGESGNPWFAIYTPSNWPDGDDTGAPGDTDSQDEAGEPGSQSSTDSSTESLTPSESETGDGTGVDGPAETPGG